MEPHLAVEKKGFGSGGTEMKIQISLVLRFPLTPKAVFVLALDGEFERLG